MNFVGSLEYKAQLYGSKLVIVDRFYPSGKTCSSCGEKKISLSLSQRVFKCEYCGFKCDRDLNAAVNLSKEAVNLTVLACGLVKQRGLGGLSHVDTRRVASRRVRLLNPEGGSADTSRMKQEEKAGNC
ncbi:transposase [Anabaena sphaerica]|uniref:transposase n=1 Tax=Anabaena sphaerica TaxID=212446 RepID=UPI001F54B0F9|nr:transposase [Anabaena sphaerica]